MNEMLKIPRNVTSPVLSHEKTFDDYADMYQAAAEVLWKVCQKGSKHFPTPKYVTLPVLFLLHHFVELELKEVIRLSYSLGRRRGVCVTNGACAQDVPNIHDLNKLLKMADSNLKQLKHDSPFLTGEHRDLIADLQKFGQSGEALRYPEGTRKTGKQATLPANYVADVSAVMKTIESMWGSFSNALGSLSDYDPS